MSKTQSAGSGMRPKVGRTERSQPKTRPMTRAPPLAVRLRGRSPTLSVSAPDQAADQDAEADEDDVGLARGPLDVAESRAGPLDVGLGAREPQEVAAVQHACPGAKGISSPAADELQQHDAASVLVAASSASVRSATSACVTTTSRAAIGKSRSSRSSTSPPSGELGASRTAGAADDHDVARAEDRVRSGRRGARRRAGSAARTRGRARRSPRPRPRGGRRRPRRCGRPARPLAVGRARPTRPPVAAPPLPRASGSRPEVHPEQPRRQARQEPDHEAGAHEVADRVGHRDVVQQPRPSRPRGGRGGRSCCRRCR